MTIHKFTTETVSKCFLFVSDGSIHYCMLCTQASMYLNICCLPPNFYTSLSLSNNSTHIVWLCAFSLSIFDQLHIKIKQCHRVSNVQRQLRAEPCSDVCVCLQFIMMFKYLSVCASESKCLPSSENHNKVHTNSKRNTKALANTRKSTVEIYCGYEKVCVFAFCIIQS